MVKIVTEMLSLGQTRSLGQTTLAKVLTKCFDKMRILDQNEIVEINQEYKEKIEKYLLDTIVVCLDKGTLKEADLAQVADFVLERIDLVNNQEELIQFLNDLSAKWPVFDDIKELTKGEVKEVREDKAETTVLDAAREGDVEEAINLAKGAMEN